MKIHALKGEPSYKKSSKMNVNALNSTQFVDQACAPKQEQVKVMVPSSPEMKIVDFERAINNNNGSSVNISSFK